jgi:hypothetical protein
MSETDRMSVASVVNGGTFEFRNKAKGGCSAGLQAESCCSGPSPVDLSRSHLYRIGLLPFCLVQTSNATVIVLVSKHGSRNMEDAPRAVDSAIPVDRFKLRNPALRDCKRTDTEYGETRRDDPSKLNLA